MHMIHERHGYKDRFEGGSTGVVTESTNGKIINDSTGNMAVVNNREIIVMIHYNLLEQTTVLLKEHLQTLHALRTSGKQKNILWRRQWNKKNFLLFLYFEPCLFQTELLPLCLDSTSKQ